MKIIKLIAFVLVCSFVLGACSGQMEPVPDNGGSGEAGKIAIGDNNDVKN